MQAKFTPGTVIGGRFTLGPSMGAGGLGEVYRATDAKTRKTVAVRVLADGLAETATELETLRAEVKIASALIHKNIVATYGMGKDGDTRYIAFEFVEGQSLRQLIEQKRAAQKTFSLQGAYNVIAHLCNALQHAHETTLHGGINTGNVMVSASGRVKVGDFGVIRALSPTERMSALSQAFYCLAPEATQGQLDRRADIYSLGVVLFELLTGTPPSDTFERLSGLRPKLPEGLDDVVARCLRPSAQDRFATALDLKAALTPLMNAAAGAGSTPPPSGPAPMAQPEPRRSPSVQVAAVAAPAPAPAPSTQAAARAPAPAAAAAPTTNTANMPTRNPVRPTPNPVAPAAAPAPNGSTPGGPGPRAVNVDINAILGPGHADPEKWLVQKGNLDYGPFTLRDLIGQIEKGEVLETHIIVDRDSGSRRPVSAIAELAPVAHAFRIAREQAQSRDAEQKSRSVERGKGLIFALIAVGVLACAGGGVWYFLKQAKTSTNDTSAVLAGADDLDVSSIKIETTVETPATAKAKGRRRGGGGRNRDSFDGPVNLGDVSSGGGDEQLSQEQINAVMRSRIGSLAPCMGAERRRDPSFRSLSMDFIVRGSGQVSAVRVNGSDNSALASCMRGRMAGFRFPKFNGSRTVATFNMSLK